jgi:hypothetical protein
MDGALSHVTVLDLSRVLAGPWAGQVLADLGADVIKIERPGTGDDTRGWGPPFLRDAQGNDSADAAYYLCANRNKKSVTVDFTTVEGQSIVRELARLLAQVNEFDLVCGYRIDRQDHWTRKLYSWGYNQLVRSLLGTRVRDCDCALKVLRREMCGPPVSAPCESRCGISLICELIPHERQPRHHVLPPHRPAAG